MFGKYAMQFNTLKEKWAMPEDDDSEHQELWKLLATQEELHPDLSPWLAESGGSWAMLRHPLVYMVPYHAAQNAFANRQYQYKLTAAREAHEKEDWNTYLALHERPWRVDAFKKIRPALHGRVYWETVSWLWTDCENNWQNRSAWRRIWSSKEPERESVMDDEERQHLQQMPDTFPVYRGVRLQSAVRGLSWTIDHDKAVWFAQRFRLAKQKAILVSAEIQKTQAIAYFIGRKESEIVIHPNAMSKLIVTQNLIP